MAVFLRASRVSVFSTLLYHVSYQGKQLHYKGYWTQTSLTTFHLRYLAVPKVARTPDNDILDFWVVRMTYFFQPTKLSSFPSSPPSAHDGSRRIQFFVFWLPASCGTHWNLLEAVSTKEKWTKWRLEHLLVQFSNCRFVASERSTKRKKSTVKRWV